jgi:hypothetical protein
VSPHNWACLPSFLHIRVALHKDALKCTSSAMCCTLSTCLTLPLRQRLVNGIHARDVCLSSCSLTAMHNADPFLLQSWHQEICCLDVRRVCSLHMQGLLRRSFMRSTVSHIVTHLAAHVTALLALAGDTLLLLHVEATLAPWKSIAHAHCQCFLVHIPPSS